MELNGSRWKAQVTPDLGWGWSVRIAELHYPTMTEILELRTGQPPLMEDHSTLEVGPRGIILPYDAAEPLRDALSVALGNRPDDYRAKYEEARDALEVERRRVDDLLKFVQST